jgi:PAS domain S-box-containing protein
MMDYTQKTNEELIQELQDAKKELELQKSELSDFKNHFELVLTAANFAWWEMDVPTGNVKFSDHKAQMLGYSPKKFNHYKDFMSLVHPDDYENTMLKMLNHFHGKADNYNAYYRIQNSTGEYKLFHDIGRITKRDSNGKPKTVYGIVMDVADKPKLDEVIRESESHFKYMFQDNKSVMLLIDPHSGKIVDANTSAVEFYKYTIDELKSMNIENINTLSHDQIIVEKEKAISSKQNVFKFPHRLSNGEIRQVNVSSTLINYNNQQVLFSIIEDITEQLRLENELKKSEDELKKAEIIGKFGNWKLHLNEKLMTSSDGARLIYGFDSNENMLEKVKKQALSEYRPMLDSALFNLLNSGKKYDVEYKIKRESDGKIIDIHSVAEYDASKNIVFGTIHDISDRKKAEEAMRQSEEKFRTLYANMIDGSALHALVYNDKGVPEDYQIIEVNPAFELQLGISRESVINKTSKLAYGVENPPYFDIYSKVALTGVPEVFETYFAPLDKYFSISVYCPCKGSFATIFENITDRRKAEQALQVILTKYKVLFDILPIGITISDTDGKIIESNRIAEATLGISREEQEKRKIDGHEWRIIRSDGTTMPCSEYASVQALELNCTVSNVEMGIVKGDNQITWLNVSATPIPIEGYGVAIIYSDILERKQAELKIQQQNKELVKLNTDKDLFISILAHDLKSPFQSLLGFSELLLENIHKYDISKIEKQLSLINNATQNIYALLEDLLMWTRSQSGRLKFEPIACDLEILLDNITQVLSPNANSKKITINQNMHGCTRVFADSNMLKTIMRNLISNAIKYSNCEGTIDIHAHSTVTEITISIADNGVGMEPQILETLFDIAKIQTTVGTAGEKGTGLGLLLCKEFVEKHGGEIWVESQVGHGSTFKFTLPHYENL